MNPNETGSLFYIIPAPVMNDKSLNHAEKLTLALIYGLAREDGTCYPSNDWIGKKLDLGTRAVQDIIAKLDALGYLNRKTISHANNPMKKYRIINIPITFNKSLRSAENCTLDYAKKSLRYAENCTLDMQKTACIIDKKDRINKKDKKAPGGAYPTAEAAVLSSLLFDQLKKKRKQVKKESSWDNHFRELMKTYSFEQIKVVIEWFITSDFWIKPIKDAKSFCKNFESMQIQMAPMALKRTESGLELIKKIGCLPYDLLKGKIELGGDYVDFGATQGAGTVISHYYSLGQKDFVSKVLAQLEKMGLLHLFEDWFDKYREE